MESAQIVIIPSRHSTSVTQEPSPSRLKRQRPDLLLLILTTLLFDGKWEGKEKWRKRDGGEMEQGKRKDERTDRKMGGVDLSTPLAYFV